MRFLVSSGMARADGESLRTAETVPGVRPRCCATALRVMTPDIWPDLLFRPMVLFNHFLGALHRPICLRVSFAVWLGTAQREKQNIHVTNDRQEECVMNPNAVRNPTLGDRDECAANDGHDHDARTISSQGSQLRNAQREDTRE